MSDHQCFAHGGGILVTHSRAREIRKAVEFDRYSVVVACMERQSGLAKTKPSGESRVQFQTSPPSPLQRSTQ
jgi:hypothetical protein